MDKNKIACECSRVTYAKIEAAVKNGAASFEEVVRATGCSRHCGSCEDFIRHYVGELLSSKTP